MHGHITVIGEGDLSTTVTLLLAVRCPAQVTVVQDDAQAVARDLAAAAAMLGCGARVQGVEDLSRAPGAASP